jgi:hypothetical protein
MKLTQKESTETELWLFNYRFLKFIVLANSMVTVQISGASGSDLTTVRSSASALNGRQLTFQLGSDLDT